VHLFQVLDEARVDVVGFELRVAPQVFRGLLELAVVVHVMLHEIADLFRRHVREVEPRLPLSFEEARRQVLGGFAGLVVRAVERQDGARDRGARRRELADFGRQDVLPLEERIGERLEERRHEAPVLVVRESGKLDAEELREPDQERGRERPVVVLDQIEVARRDTEALGEIRLAQALATPERAHLGPQSRRLFPLLGLGVHDDCLARVRFDSFYNFTAVASLSVTNRTNLRPLQG
jgi:hypothetical protein